MKRVERLQVFLYFIFRHTTGNETIFVDQADRLCAVLGALRLLNVFVDSRNERVLFFTFVKIVATLLVRDS